MRLINRQEVIDFAYSDMDQITNISIKDTKIDAAQEKYLRPVFGKLFDAMMDGKYADFVVKFIKPPLAYYVRYGVIPDSAVKSGNMGLQQPYTQFSHASSNKDLTMIRDQALDDANHLLKIAIRHVEEHCNDFPEYESRKNIQKKVKFKGGIIL